MATFSSIFTPAGGTNVSGSIGAGTSTAEIVVQKNQLFVCNADGDINIQFGNSGMAAADATSFRIPSGSMAVYDPGDCFDRIRIFNNTASTVNYWMQKLARNA